MLFFYIMLNAGAPYEGTYAQFFYDDSAATATEYALIGLHYH